MGRGLQEGRGARKLFLWRSWKPPPPSRCRAARSRGLGYFVRLTVMHGPTRSPHTAVNSGAAAAPALQALGNARLRSALQINTICSAERGLFLHYSHSLLPRRQCGERGRQAGSGGECVPSGSSDPPRPTACTRESPGPVDPWTLKGRRHSWGRVLLPVCPSW